MLQYFYLKNDTNMLEAVVLHDKILLIFKQQIRFSYKLIVGYSKKKEIKNYFKALDQVTY